MIQYRKNELVTVEIEDIGSDGEGIGKADGFPLFVKDAIVGDIVEARIVKAKKIMRMRGWRRWWCLLLFVCNPNAGITGSAEDASSRPSPMKNNWNSNRKRLWTAWSA